MSRLRPLSALLLAFTCALASSARAEPADRPLAPRASDPRAVTDAASEVLLRTALEASARGDDAEVIRWLRAWASLGARERDVPAALSARAADAITWANERGSFGVFASRTAERVSVGVHDPAELLLRVDAWVEDGGELRRVNRGEDERADRREYPFAEARLQTAVVVIDAVGRVGRDDLLLARVVLQPAALLPPAPPDPSKPAERLARRDLTPAPAPTVLVPWWWMAAGTIAVVLAGAGVWQELER